MSLLGYRDLTILLWLVPLLAASLLFCRVRRPPSLCSKSGRGGPGRYYLGKE